MSWCRLVSLGVIATLAICLRPLPPCPAVESTGQDVDASQPLRFRRVFAPEDHLPQWPLGDTVYLRMEPAEFERLAAKLARGDRGSAPSPGAARVLRAEYRARFENGQLRDGLATLQVEHRASGAAAVLMPLAPCGVAMADVRWAADPNSTDPAAGDGRRVAQIGLGGDGNLSLLVAEPGALHFDWSVNGEPMESGGYQFNLPLPQCPVNRLLLELPDDFVARIENAVPLPSKPLGAGRRLWHFELGGRHACRLRIMPAEKAARAAELVALRESVAYDLSPQGLEIATRWNLASRHGPVHEVVLALDGQTQVVAAMQGDRSIPWSIQPHTDGTEPQRVTLTLAEPIRGKPMALLVQALSPVVTERSWRLPRPQIEAARWQEGTATVLVPGPLSVRRLDPIGCRQTALTPLPEPRDGESWQFQLFSADAALDVVIAPTEGRLEVASGTALQWRPDGLKALVTADLRIRRAERFTLHAALSRRWVLDSVETVPPEAIEDWTLARGPKGSHRLSIRLAQALAPSRPLRVRVAAHRLHAPPGEPLNGDDLVPLRFVGSDADGPTAATGTVEEKSQWVAVSTPGFSYPKLAHGAGLRPIDPTQLTEAQNDLLGTPPPEALVFDRTAGPRGLQVALETEKPRYHGTVKVEAEAVGSVLREHYRVRCVPGLVPVDRLLVSFSHAREAPLHWTLAGAADNARIAARRLASGEIDAAGVEAMAETWELRLHQPRREPFELQGGRETEFGAEQPVSLLFLPESASQQATVEIRGSARDFWVENQGLEAVPVPTEPAASFRATLGFFAYCGKSEAAVRSGTGVSLVRNPNVPTAAVWAWNSHLRSSYGADGSGHHVAIYQLENTGAGHFALGFPDAGRESSIREVFVNGERLERLSVVRTASGEDVENRPRIALPASVRFPTVAVYFATPRRPWGILDSIAPPWPQAELPELNRHWTVRLPAGYEHFEADPRWKALRPEQRSLARRIFGPLGREDQPLFNPLDIRTWLPPATEALAHRRIDGNAKRLLQKLGGPIQPGARGRTDWGEILGNPTWEKFSPRLLVDRPATARQGLAPRTPVLVDAAGDSLRRGRDMLEAGGLCLLVHRNVAVLTSRIQAAVYRGHLLPIESGNVWAVQPGPLAEQLVEAAGQHGAGGLIPASAWARQPSPPELLWGRTGDARENGPGMETGSLVSIENPVNRPLRLPLVHRRTMRLFAVVAFLAVIALAWWKAANRPIVLAMGAGVFGAAALIVPSAWLPVTTAGVLACLCWLLIWLVRRSCERAKSPEAELELSKPEDTATFPTLSPWAPMLFLAAAVGSTGSSALGEEATTTANTLGAETVHRVFIPYDEATQEPTGGKYYVPRDFYNRLYRGEAALNEKPQGWLITGATYRGALVREAASDRLAIEEFQAVFDLQILTPGARVRIPLLRQSANLLPEGTVLDGRVIQPEWDAGNEELWFEAEETGPCRLRLALRPTVGQEATPSRFALAIPRLPTARLELTVPPGTPALAFPTAQGTARFEEASQRWMVKLGATDRLEVRWPEAVGAILEVDQLLWWKARPGSVAIDVRFDLRMPEKPVDRLRLAVDRGLRLLPLSGEDAPVAEFSDTTDQRQVVEFRWPRPVGSEATLRATFLMTGCSGLGNYTLPEIEVLDASVARRWLAVSVDPSMQYQPPPQTNRLEALAVPDFAAAWGAAAAPPLAAYRLSGVSDACRIATRPRAPVTTATQRTTVHFDGHEASIVFEAALATTLGYRFQHRLRIPRDLHVETVSVVDEADTEMVARFAQTKDGRVSVFLTKAASGAGTLSLQGRMPTPLGKSLALPTVCLEEVEVESSRMTLLREPEVRIEMAGEVPPAETPDLPANERTGESESRAQLVARFELDPREPAPVTLKLQPTRTQAAAAKPRDRKTQSDQKPSIDHATAAAADRRTVGEKTGKTPPGAAVPTDEEAVGTSVELADVRVAWKPDGSLGGVVTFDLRPGSSGGCRLRVPPDCRLVDVRLDEAPSPLLLVRPRVWRVPLGRPGLPQRLTVVFTGKATEAGGSSRRFAVPWPEDAEVARTLWTVRSPAMYTAADEAKWVPGWKLDRARLDSVSRLIAQGADVLSEMTAPAEAGETPEESEAIALGPPGSDGLSGARRAAHRGSPRVLRPWYARWARYFAQSREALLRRLDASDADEQTQQARQALRRIDQDQSLIAERLGCGGRLAEVLDRQAVSSDATELWQGTFDPEQAAVHTALDGGVDSLSVPYRAEDWSHTRERWLAALGLLGLVGLGVVARWRGWPGDVARRRPYRLAVAAGAVWWLMLTPSILGGAIVLTALLVALRRRRSRAASNDGSTIVAMQSLWP